MITAAVYNSEAEIIAAYKARQARYRAAANRNKPKLAIAAPCPVMGSPEHVAEYKATMAAKMIRPEVLYLKRRCKEMGVSYLGVIGPSMCLDVLLPRQILMTECKEVLGLSAVETGRAFGGRSHSTAFNAWRRIEKMRAGSE